MKFANHSTPRGGVVYRCVDSIDLDFWLSSESSDESYCLDAPSVIPAGSTRAVTETLQASTYTLRGR